MTPPSGPPPGGKPPSGPSYAAQQPPPQPQPGRGPLPILCALGFVFLVACIAYLWEQQQQLTQAPTVDPAAFAGMQGDVRTLQSRLAQSEQRSATDLRPLEGRVAALEKRPDAAPAAAAAPAPAVDLKPLTDRIAALENRPPPPAPDIAGPIDAAVAPLAQRIDALSGKVDALSAKVDASDAKIDASGTSLTSKVDAATARNADAVRQLTARVEAMEQKVAAAQQQEAKQAQQSLLAIKAQAALTALEAGRPLGDIPGAPPSVSKFAATKPPTEGDLRLAFPAAAARAIDASRPNNQALPLGLRILQHVETLVTVRQGDKVVVGTTAAQTLGQAQAQLDAGNLAGAVATVNTLDPGAAGAMAGWKAQAQAVLDARAALSAMTEPASH